MTTGIVFFPFFQGTEAKMEDKQETKRRDVRLTSSRRGLELVSFGKVNIFRGRFAVAGFEPVRPCLRSGKHAWQGHLKVIPASSYNFCR